MWNTNGKMCFCVFNNYLQLVLTAGARALCGTSAQNPRPRRVLWDGALPDEPPLVHNVNMAAPGGCAPLGRLYTRTDPLPASPNHRQAADAHQRPRGGRVGPSHSVKFLSAGSPGSAIYCNGGALNARRSVT